MNGFRVADGFGELEEGEVTLTVDIGMEGRGGRSSEAEVVFPAAVQCVRIGGQDFRETAGKAHFDSFEGIDGFLENAVGDLFVAGKGGPTGGGAEVAFVAGTNICAATQQHFDGGKIPVKRGGMKGCVAVCGIDGGEWVVAHVRGGSHLEEHGDDFGGGFFRGANDEGPPPVAGLEAIGVAAEEVGEGFGLAKSNGGRQADGCAVGDELIDHGPVALYGGGVQGRESGIVERIAVGTEFEEGKEGIEALFHHSKMKRMAAAVGEVHAAFELLRVVGDKLTDGVQCAEGDGGEDVMHSAAGQQQIHYFLFWGTEAGGPADDLEFMRIAEADGVRAAIQKEADDSGVSLFSGEVQGGGAVAFAANGGIGSPLEEEADHGLALGNDGKVEGGAHAGAAAFVDDFGIGVEDGGDMGSITGGGGFTKQADGSVSMAEAIVGENVPAQGGPIREAVHFGDLPLRFGECGGLAFLESRFRLFLEMLQVWARRKLLHG